MYNDAYKTLKLCLMSDPLSLDTRKNTDNITGQFALFIYEGLTRNTPKGLELALAKDVNISLDKKEYLFTIRQSCFSDGKLITARDFEDSWKQVLDPSFAAYNPDYLFCIKNARKAYLGECPINDVGIKALDDRTLKVELEYPEEYFLELVATKIFFPMPRSLSEEASSSSQRKKVFVSSGPFVIKKWLRQNKILLKKNPHYWDQESVRIQKIELQIIEDEMTQLSLFEKKHLDWAGSPLSMLPVDSIKRLKQKMQVCSFPTASLYFYSFNTQKYPLNNVNLRKALTLAINRKELIEHVTQGFEVPALALLPSKMHGIHKNYFLDGDIQRANVYLDKALHELKLTRETFPTVVLSYPNIQTRHVLAQAIQQQWLKGLGIKVQLDSKEWQVFLSDMNGRNYQIGALGRGTHHLDPYYYLSLFKESKQKSNKTGWEDPRYIHLLKKAVLALDASQKELMLNEAEELFMSDMPLAPIMYPTNFYIKNSKLKGVYLSDVGSVDFKWAYFE